MDRPELASARGKLGNGLPGWYKGYGEKCILQPLSKATDAARQYLPRKNIGKYRGILGSLRPASTASQIALAEREGFELPVRHRARTPSY
jgi:hypothetical protein